MMARFRATGAVVIGAVKYEAGTTFADAAGSVQPGDVLWLGLDKTKMSPNLVPLDAGAQSIMNASRFAGEPPWGSDGAGSIR
jgi:hypothetical protein